MASVTLEQLKLCTLHFAHSGLEKRFFIDTNAAPYHYQEVILFCGPYNKGKALVEILERLNYRPRIIIFVDDVLKHVENVADAVQNLDNTIEFRGIRYAHLDDFAFDPKLAEKEFAAIKDKIIFKE